MTEIQKDNKKIANVPNLRFPEFVGEWEVKKLGEVMDFKVTNSFSRENLNYEYGTVKNIHYGDIHTKFQTLFDINCESVPFINEEININRISDENYCKNGDVIFADASEDLNDVGKSIEVINTNGEKLLSGLHTLLARPKQNLFHIGFNGYLFRSNSVRTQIQKESQGSKVLSINVGRISKIELTFPPIDEQKKITSLLSLLDKRTQTQNKIIKELHVLKASTSKKIFSQEFRFKDEKRNDFPDWESKKLGEVLNKYDEKTTFNNQYPILTSSRTGIYFQKDYFDGNDVASKDNTGYNIVPKGYFTYRHMSDDIIFKFNINTICEKGIVSTLYPVFTTIGLNDYFLKTYLNEGQGFKNYALMQKQGGSRTYMYYTKLIQLELSFPSFEEQTKIANFLSFIDSKIDIETQLLQNLEEQKKFLLQQMFV